MDRYQPMPLSIHTDRLLLRLRGPEDAASNLELLSQGQSEPLERTLAEERLRLAEQHDQALRRGFGFFAVVRKAAGETIGYCGLLVGRCTFDEPEIAYELLTHARGYGYATESAAAVVTAAFGAGRRRIWATVRAWNTPSLRVLQRIGFRRQHAIVDEVGELVYLRRDARWNDDAPRTMPLPFDR
jgi:RimJ/RimL family protein N-acetyltransferase